MTEWTQKQIDAINKDANLEGITWIRDAAKKFGIACSFADDDFKIICYLANNAIENQLVGELPDDIKEKLTVWKD